jgi:hypothetical protein
VAVLLEQLCALLRGVHPQSGQGHPLAEAELDAAVVRIDAALAPCACGSVGGFLPPSALLVAVHGGAAGASAALAALAALRAASHIDDAALLPPHLRSDLLTAMRSRAAQELPPLRTLAVSLMEGDGGSRAALERACAALALVCPTCVLLPAASGGSLGGGAQMERLAPRPPARAHISSLGGDCAARCDAGAPAACGCIIPSAYVEALTALHELLWVTAHSAPVAHNAFARLSTMTSDLVSSVEIADEYGACADSESGDCAPPAQGHTSEALSSA